MVRLVSGWAAGVAMATVAGVSARRCRALSLQQGHIRQPPGGAVDGVARGREYQRPSGIGHGMAKMTTADFRTRRWRGLLTSVTVVAAVLRLSFFPVPAAATGSRSPASRSERMVAASAGLGQRSSSMSGS